MWVKALRTAITSAQNWLKTAHDGSGNVEEGVQEGNCYKNFILFIFV